MPAPIQNYVGWGIFDNLDQLAVLALAKAAELRQFGTPANDARAYEVEKAITTLYERAEAIALEWGVKGTELLRESERETRVRPDTLGQGGPRLGDSLFTEPLPGAIGSIGIANEDILDAHVPWWPTNEFGSTTQVGRILFGAFFEPGPETRPQASLAQEHALFEPRGRGDFRGSGEIRHPIAPKRFIRDAWQEIEVGWSADIDVALGQFVAALP